MFKRVFISLLILSAFASEGITNIPLGIYGLYSEYADFFCSEERESAASECLPAGDTDSAALCPVQSGRSIIISKYSIEKVKINGIIQENKEPFTAILPFNGIQGVSEHSFSPEDNVFLKSGLSPPYTRV